MGIAENGPFGTHRGKIGKLVYYELNGKMVVREAGVSTKPPTGQQLKAQMQTQLSSQFFSTILPFINVSFSAVAAKERLNAHNLAMKQKRSTILKGDYPDVELVFDKIQVSSGELMPAVDPEVIQLPERLQFNWHTDPQMKWAESTDQVMLLAYFPEEKEMVYKLLGNNRLSGEDLLDIPEGLRGKYMETYIAFSSADRKAQSDSIYTGSFNT